MSVANATPTNKIDFYHRYLRGEFGNRPRTWAWWHELRDSDYHGRVTLRDVTRGGTCVYNVHVDDLRNGKWPEAFASRKHCIRTNESMSDEHLTIQGNVWLSHKGLELEYSCEPGIGHRQAVKQPYVRSAEGLTAKGLLSRFLDPSSLEDLQELLQTHSEAVIEFSTYRVPVGVLPHRNTVFWEVRAY